MDSFRLHNRLAAATMLVTLAGCGGGGPGITPKPAKPTGAGAELEDPEVECRLHHPQFRKNEDSPDEKRFGAWKTVIPRRDGAAIDNILGMQTVHSVMLPSGKILLVSGSSWRNLRTTRHRDHPFRGIVITRFAAS